MIYFKDTIPTYKNAEVIKFLDKAIDDNVAVWYDVHSTEDSVLHSYIECEAEQFIIDELTKLIEEL